MSDYGKTQNRLRNRLAARAKDIYSRARIYRLPHARILDLLGKDIYNGSDWAHASGYVQSYVHGILDMLASDHYHVLTFGFVQEDGRILTTDELRQLYGSEWHLYCTSENGHYFYHEDADRPLF